MAAEPGPVALVGSGEYLPSMLDIERELIDGRPPRYVQLATAAAPEGDDVISRWHRLGREQAGRLGVEQVVVDVRTRGDADDPALARLIDGAGLIYLSGGNPGFLAETLRGTAVWTAIEAAWRGGSALAGCSAGAMAMAEQVPTLRHPFLGDTPGLALLPGLRVLPHFDKLAGWVPDLATRPFMHGTDDVVLLGIDEETALVGGPDSWTVRGHRSVWRLERDGRIEHPPGSTLTLG
jgi:cyanophycinase-like exopeptidase